MRTKLKKSLATLGLVAVAGMTAAPAAFAAGDTSAVDTAIATAMDSAQTSATTTMTKAAGVLTSVAVAAVALGIGVSYIKKVRGAAR